MCDVDNICNGTVGTSIMAQVAAPKSSLQLLQWSLAKPWHKRDTTLVPEIATLKIIISIHYEWNMWYHIWWNNAGFKNYLWFQQIWQSYCIGVDIFWPIHKSLFFGGDPPAINERFFPWSRVDMISLMNHSIVLPLWASTYHGISMLLYLWLENSEIFGSAFRRNLDIWYTHRFWAPPTYCIASWKHRNTHGVCRRPHTPDISKCSSYSWIYLLPNFTGGSGTVSIP